MLPSRGREKTRSVSAKSEIMITDQFLLSPIWHQCAESSATGLGDFFTIWVTFDRYLLNFLAKIGLNYGRSMLKSIVVQ